MTLALSLFFSLVGYLTAWIGVSIVIFPPIAAYFGWRYYQAFLLEVPSPIDAEQAMALLPLVIAILVFVWGCWLMADYKA